MRLFQVKLGGKMFRRLRCRATHVASKTLTALGIGLCAAGPLAIQAHAATSNPIVTTAEGKVEGFVVAGVAEFLGIPYAAPPVSTNPSAPACSPTNLRWCPTVAHAPWSGVLKAMAFGPTCAQNSELGVFAGPPNNNEDCLYLNVYKPANAKGRLAVIVFIHGGGSIDGESNDYDGSKLAAQGNTVVVTINYRLGLLGFFAHPAIDAEGHLFGNYGQLDQQFALQWVQNNIAKFGGDPNDVTVGGQSAGSEATLSNVVSPLAKGLFHRAILESVTPEPTSLSDAESNAEAFAKSVGCGSGAGAAVARCLRGLTVPQILTGQARYGARYIMDGQILPKETNRAAIKAGHFNHVPIMSGTTLNEGTFTLMAQEYYESPRVPFTAANYTAQVNSFTGSENIFGPFTNYPAGTPEAVAAHYPLTAYPNPAQAMAAITTDGWACQQHFINGEFASQVPVYAYEFDDQTAPSYYPQMPGLQPLAYHTADLQYYFPLFHGGPLGIVHPLNSHQEVLSDELVAAWTNFAWTGNPNGGSKVKSWPLYNPDKPKASTILVENVPALSAISSAQFVAEHQCAFWDSILTY
ncbi:MAG TPA: carboxylesterase family protein [Gemmataceae bacterium]|nr:carboxylesterase family protein [Gemmataceae bacterium]